MYNIISDSELIAISNSINQRGARAHEPRYPEFAIRFRALCNKLKPGATQKELEQWLGYKQPTINDWLNGRKLPCMDTSINICKVMDCPVDWLLTGRMYN